MTFDDIVSDENGESAWTYACPKHLPNIADEYYGSDDDCALDGAICGVKGCENEATHYFTFHTKRAI